MKSGSLISLLTLLVAMCVLCGGAARGRGRVASLSKLAPAGTRTTAANALWSDDAFPTLPQLAPNETLTIGYWNSTGGGVVTNLHLVLVGAPAAVLRRRVALKIVYDDLPFPSVFVPVGDFFLDTAGGASEPYESLLFAKRPVGSWHSVAELPYAASLRLELVNGADAVVAGYAVAYHESRRFAAGVDSYFHAVFSGNPSVAFPWEPVPLLPAGTGVAGPGHIVGVSLAFSAAAEVAPAFPGNFDHVCEGNWEFFFDNTTRAFGNDTAVNPASAGFAVSEHVLAVLGSEDLFGYSYGWGGDERILGVNESLYGTERSGTTVWQHPAADGSVRLSTYRFWDAPLRFSRAAWAQVNWGYDVGHNVPADLCPPAPAGCRVTYDVMTYVYLAAPRDASADAKAFPWPTGTGEPANVR